MRVYVCVCVCGTCHSYSAAVIPNRYHRIFLIITHFRNVSFSYRTVSSCHVGILQLYILVVDNYEHKTFLENEKLSIFK